MNVFVSVAVTADGYLDDTSAKRLMISSEEDWTEVRRLRGQFDAILVGAETLRHDDPSLILSDPQIRKRRSAEGRCADLIKVTVTASGNLNSEMRFFREGPAEKIVFSKKELPHLQGIATVISADHPITAAYMITELEKRGIEKLFVEGGSKILNMFFAEGQVDTLRLAVNPDLQPAVDGKAPKLDIGHDYRTAPHTAARYGNMEVTTYMLRPDREAEDRKYLQMAIDESRKCTPGFTSYCVGAVVVTARKELFPGYTHETSPTRHAEQEAIAKAVAAGAALHGATIYCSMEPCSQRSSEPVSCSELILDHGINRVVFALYEPDRFVCCRGALNLRERGVEVRAYPSMGEEVRRINGHLCR